MRYLMIVKGDENFEASGPPPKALMDAIEALMTQQASEGKIVSFGGLQHTSKGTRVRIRGGKLVTTDGPFTETKEMIGGFTILELPSLDAAREETEKFMELHRLHWPGWDGEAEVRLMFADNEGP